MIINQLILFYKLNNKMRSVNIIDWQRIRCKPKTRANHGNYEGVPSDLDPVAAVTSRSKFAKRRLHLKLSFDSRPPADSSFLRKLQGSRTLPPDRLSRTPSGIAPGWPICVAPPSLADLRCRAPTSSDPRVHNALCAQLRCDALARTDRHRRALASADPRRDALNLRHG
jgi:hypothetical protein